MVAWTPIPHEFDGHADVAFSDLGAFLDYVFTHQRCAIIVDEAGEAVSAREIADTAKLATRSRHLGHAVHFCAQRAAGLIAPLVRDQCERAYIFRVSASDARDLANEWGHPEIASAAHFERGEYFRVTMNACEKRVISLPGV